MYPSLIFHQLTYCQQRPWAESVIHPSRISQWKKRREKKGQRQRHLKEFLSETNKISVTSCWLCTLGHALKDNFQYRHGSIPTPEALPWDFFYFFFPRLTHGESHDRFAFMSRWCWVTCSVCVLCTCCVQKRPARKWRERSWKDGQRENVMSVPRRLFERLEFASKYEMTCIFLHFGVL